MRKYLLIGAAALALIIPALAADVTNPNVGANPSGTAADTAVNGSALTFMRSDGAPAVQKATSSVYGLTKFGSVTTSVASTTTHTGGMSANASGTYTVPVVTPPIVRVEFILVGGGGGGASAPSGGTGNVGGDTCLKASGAACTTPLYDAGGGGGGTTTNGGAGGVISGSAACDWQVVGGTGLPGADGSAALATAGGSGGNSSLGGGGGGAFNATGGVGALNSGGGGAGGGAVAGVGSFGGAGGGGAATCHVIVNGPAATYTYAVGDGGTTGAGGTNPGGKGASGQLIAIEYPY